MKRGTKLILGFGFLFCFLAALSLIVFGAIFFTLKGSGPSIGGKNVLVFEWQGPLMEVPRLSTMQELLGQEPLTLWEMTECLRLARDDKSVAAVVARVGLIDGGLAKVQELRDALEDFAQSKPVFVFAEYGTGKTLYLASAATDFYTTPTSVFEVGLLAEVPFYARTLEKLRIEADIEAVGKYKAAGEAYERTSMSEPYRESMNALYDGFYNQMVSGISKARKIDPAIVRRAFDKGLLSASACVELGLANGALYGDQLWDQVALAVGPDATRLDPKAYHSSQTSRSSFRSGPRIAVIFAEGVIMSGPSEAGLFGSVIGSDTLVSVLRDIRESRRAEAVVLRVDSPGGSGLASDLIWREMELLNQEGIPTVVSMSDVAASGGYYIAMGADRIVAQPGTITGSIGVLAGKFSLGGFYDWVGMDVDRIQRGENATFSSLSQKFTPSERAVLREHLDEFYNGFVSKAATGRGVTYAEMDQSAQGRVWIGADALQQGLIDIEGGLRVAIGEAKILIGVPVWKDVRLDYYPRRKTFFEKILETDSGPVIIQELPAEVRQTLTAATLLERLSKQGPMAVWLDGVTRF